MSITIRLVHAAVFSCLASSMAFAQLPDDKPGWMDRLKGYMADKVTDAPSQTYDLQKWLPTLRKAAYEHNWNVQTTKRNVAWVLVQHEWLGYRRAQSPTARQSAAFQLQMAIRLFAKAVSFSNGTKVALTVDSKKKLAVAVDYLRYVSEQDRAQPGLSRAELESKIRVELAKIISPSSNVDANVDIQKPVQELFQKATEMIGKAQISRYRAAEQLDDVYGRGELLKEHLAKSEYEILGSMADSVAEFVKELLPERPADVKSIIERYAALRKRVFGDLDNKSELDANGLDMTDKDASSTATPEKNIRTGYPHQDIDTFFGNKARDDELRKRLQSFAKEGYEDLKPLVVAAIMSKGGYLPYTKKLLQMKPNPISQYADDLADEAEPYPPYWAKRLNEVWMLFRAEKVQWTQPKMEYNDKEEQLLQAIKAKTVDKTEEQK